MHKRFLREEKGFTFSEMMVTMTIMIIVLSALYSIFDMSLRTFSFGNSKEEAIGNARLGMEKMEREIRQAYAFDKGAATPDTHLLDTWTATQIRFGNDLDGNMKIECPTPEASPRCEKIGYQVYESPTSSGNYALGRDNSSTGTTNTVANLQPVVEHVDYIDSTNTGLRFRYFQRDGTTEVLPGGNEALIGMVRITLRIRVDSETQDGTQTLTTDVALRNRGD